MFAQVEWPYLRIVEPGVFDAPAAPAYCAAAPVLAAAGENDRVAALARYGVIDTPREREFDDLVQLAADICSVPIAAINLVEANRQWFKAEIGLGVREMPLDNSICAYALLQPGLLMVADLTLDDRFACNPLVQDEPNLRFYAGAALRTSDGFILGTLCVLDHVPRILTPKQIFALEALAREVVSRFELGLALDRHKGAEARLRLITEHAAEAIFQMDSSNRITFVNSAGCRMFGYAPEELLGRRLHDLLHHHYPNGRPFPAEECKLVAALSTGLTVTDVEDVCFRKDGSAVNVICSNAPILAAGAVTGAVLTMIDITRRKEAETRQAALVELGDRLRDLGDVAAIAEATGGILGETLRVSRAGYGRIDVSGEYLTVERPWMRPDQPRGTGLHRLADYGTFADSLKRGEVVAISDAFVDEKTSAQKQRFQDLSIRAFANVPILAEGRLVGLLFVHDAAPRIWTSQEVAFMRSVADRAASAIKHAEDAARQQLLTEELLHRIKNTLAMVQAIANQTMRTAESPEAARKALEARLLALSRAQDVLTRESWASAQIARVVAGALAPHLPADKGRLTAAGPEIHLSARTALALLLALHELATNATKYGALSVDAGHVRVEWHVDRAAATPMLHLCWAETGGPPVVPPARKGFGTRLVLSGFPTDFESALAYAPSGLVWTLSAPVGAL